MSSGRTLSWGDPEDRVLSTSSSFEELFKDGIHTDCVLVGRGGSVKCHTAILASSSKFFRDILPPPDSDKGDTIVVLDDWDVEYISSALTILYCGAQCYKTSGRAKVNKVQELLESIGLSGFKHETVSLEEGENDFELQIQDVRTETEMTTENLDLVPNVISDIGEQCFRCGGLQSSLTEYINHLQEHKDDTRKCISKLMEKVKAKDHTADWECESCYITLLNDEEKIQLDEETCWNRLNLHQKACMEKVELEIRKIEQEMNNNNQFLPPTCEKTCKQCSRKFKLEIQLKKHMNSCPASLLSFLNATGWTECPVCNLRMTAAAMPGHLLTHYQIKDLLEADTPEAEEYRCADLQCQAEKGQLSFPQVLRLYFILHKYKNCTHSFRKNLENVLEKVPIKDIKSQMNKDQNSSHMDKENSNPYDEMPEEMNKDQNSCQMDKENIYTYDEKPEEMNQDQNSSHMDKEYSNPYDEMPEDVSCNEAGASVMSAKEPELTGSSKLKCLQCLRVFKDKMDYGDSNEHFCVIVGKLKEPLQEALNPTSPMLSTLQCTFCVAGPVFPSDLMLRKHICLAHKGIPIMKELKEKGLRSGKDPMSQCFYCTKELTGWENAVLHTGLDHQKLAQTLKCDTDGNGRELLKMFYPEKYHKWFVKKRKKKLRESLGDDNIDSTMDSDISTSLPNSEFNSSDKSNKRKVNVEDNELAVTAKKVKENISDSGSDPSTSTNTRLGKGKLKSGGSKDRVIMCDICPASSSASYSDQYAFKRHLASAHFYQDILKDYPNPDPPPNSNFKFPCNFPSCDMGFNTELNRVKHLGTVHRQVDRCLATPKIFEKAKQYARVFNSNSGTRCPEYKAEALTSRSENVRRVSVDTVSPSCKVCGENFPTKESLKLHTCNSLMDKIEQECMEARTRGRVSSTDSSASKELIDRTANKQNNNPNSKNANMEKENYPPCDEDMHTKLRLILSEDEEEDYKPTIQLDVIKRKVDGVCSSESDNDSSDSDSTN